ncbi:MAG: M28 family peptidase [Chloroflexota bacterium]
MRGQEVLRAGFNVVAESSQSTSPPTTLLGAHYDTVLNSAGADDNTSVIAAMIECARILVDLGIRNIRYLAFDAEEIQRPSKV